MQAWGQTTTKHNDGYISVLKVYSSATLATTATAAVVEEYTPTGASQTAPNFIDSLPTTGTNRITISGSSTTAGGITRAENGRYLVAAGYDNAVGDATTTMATSAFRTILGSGTIGTGIKGTFFTAGAANNRCGVTDDGKIGRAHV